jgi:hypothetical protein
MPDFAGRGNEYRSPGNGNPLNDESREKNDGAIKIIVNPRAPSAPDESRSRQEGRIPAGIFRASGLG